MSHRLNAQFAQVAAALDGAVANTHTTQALRARIADINANLDSRADGLASSSTRIANALAQIAESGTALRAAEARLAFQGARLKRSTKVIRASLVDLKAAGSILDQRAREARAVAETADRTAALITAIETTSARGESIDHLLAAAHEISDGTALRRAN